jgi:hypothetical protein
LLNAKGNIFITPEVYAQVKDFFEAEAQNNAQYYRLIGIHEKLSQNGDGINPNEAFAQKIAALSPSVQPSASPHLFDSSPLKNLLADNQFESVLEQLKNLTFKTENENIVFLHIAQWKSIQSNFHQKKITQEQAEVQKSNLHSALLALIDELGL